MAIARLGISQGKAAALIEFELGAFGGKIDAPWLRALSLSCQADRQRACLSQPLHHRLEKLITDMLHADQRQREIRRKVGQHLS